MAKYKGKSVRLNKPSRIRKGQVSYGRKKFQVFVKSGSKVKRVTFGDPNMKIKKSSPARRKSFRARHRCATAKDKTTPRYWSCKMWQIMARKKRKSTVNKAGNYTKPAMRKRLFYKIKACSKGGRAGQWSARKAQMLARQYKAKGGGYR